MARPELRFPEFTDEWEETVVGEIFEFINGKAHERCVDKNGEYIIVNSKFISTEGKTKKYTNKLICPLKRNDIVMVMSDVPKGRAMSKCFLIKENNKYTLNQRICGLRTEQNCVFYFYQINRNKYYLKFDNGVSQTNLRKGEVLNCPIFEASYEEQRKIAGFLSALDDVIQIQEEEIFFLEEQKKGVMQKIFNCEVRFKADDGSKYPEWKKTTIGEEGYFYYGNSAPKWSITENAITPCIRYGELYTTHDVIVKEIKSYTNIDKNNLKFSKGNEVLVPRVGEDPLDFCKCSYLPFENIAIGEMISVYNTKNNPLFISYLFNATMKYEFAKRVEGGNVSNLYYVYLEEIPISIPCLEEQRKIADCLSAYDVVIEIKKEQLRIWKEIKKGLLQQMFV